MCKGVKKKERNINLNLIKKANIVNLYNNIQKSNLCVIKLYSLVDGVLNDIIDLLSKKQLYSFILQYIHIILLLNNNGYSHCDIHIFNIGYIKTNDKYVKILNNKILTYGYIYKLIDYGNIKHINYNLNNDNKKKHYRHLNNEYNLGFINRLLYDEQKFINYLENNNIVYDKKDIYLKFIKDKKYKLFEYFSSDKLTCFYIYKILYIEEYQKSILKNKFTKVIYPVIRGDLLDTLYLIILYGKHKDIIKYFNFKLNIYDDSKK